MALRRPAEVFPPGDFLQEELEARGWTQADLASILGRPPRLVSEIVTAKRSVSPETAKGLAAAFGTSAEFWMNLESAWQLWRVRDAQSDAVSRRARLYSIAPIKEMLRRGWIENSENIEVLEKRTKDFFEGASLDEAVDFQVHAARKSTSYGDSTPSQIAWLFRVRQVARAVHAEKFSQSALNSAIERLRALLHTPEEVRQVPRILADAGIRLVIVEGLSGSRIDGACFWLDGVPVIGLSMRFDRIDYFWFTVFHELDHVRDSSALAVDIDIETANKPPLEQAADAFACDQLIPKKSLENFIARVRPLYSLNLILGFSELNQIHPGILVGQLQHRKEIAYSRYRHFLTPVRSGLVESALTDGWGMSLPAAF